MNKEQRMNSIRPGALVVVREGETRVGLKVVGFDLPENAILQLDGRILRADLDALVREKRVMGSFENGGELEGRVEEIVPPRKPLKKATALVRAVITLQDLLDFGG